MNLIRCAFYARYSSSAQRSESIDSQRRICAQYAEANGLTIVAEYIDEALTGRSDKRPSFQRMIRDSASGRWQALVVYSIDRFARNQYDSAIYERRLELNGIKIHYATQDFGDKPESIILYSVMKGYAEYYSKNLAVQVKRGLTENALKSLCNAAPPLGYISNSRHQYEIDPITAPYIRFLFEHYAAGDSLASIIRQLNASGARTRTGRPFGRSSFNYTITNELYIGTYKYGEVRTENAIPAIIPRELWDKCQLRRRRNSVAPAHSKAPDEYLLSGKLFCGTCGAPMIGDCGKSHTGKFYTYYTCANRKRIKPGTPRCSKKSEAKAVTEAAVLQFLTESLTDELIERIADAVAEYIAAQAQSDNRLPELRADLKSINTKISNVMTAIEDGLYTPALKDRLTALTAEQSAVQLQIEDEELPKPTFDRDKILFYLYSLRNGDTTSPAFHRQLLDTLLNRAFIFDNAHDEDKKITLVLNLSTNATFELTGSDLNEKVHQSAQNPNRILAINYTTIILTRQYTA